MTSHQLSGEVNALLIALTKGGQHSIHLQIRLSSIDLKIVHPKQPGQAHTDQLLPAQRGSYLISTPLRGSGVRWRKAEMEEGPREQTWIQLKNEKEYSKMLHSSFLLKPFYKGSSKSFLRLVRLLEHINKILISYRSRLSFSLIAASGFRIFHPLSGCAKSSLALLSPIAFV